MDDNLLSFAELVGEDIARLNGLTSYANTRTLEADEDLNTLQTDGRYNATFNMVDWEAQNYPGNLKGRVVVDTSATFVTQVFYSRSNLSVPYLAYRFRLTSGWSPWVSIATNQDLDSIRNNNRDTGWRDITGELTASVKSGKVLIRRTGNLVHVALDALLLDETGTTTIYRFDTPFRPDYKKAGSWYIDASSVATDGSFQISNSGYFPVYLVDPDTAMTANFSFATGREWPTTLPGTPV